MKFCKYCGASIEEKETICPYCKKTIGTPAVKNDDKKIKGPTKLPSKIKMIVAVAAIAVVALIVLLARRCDYSGCRNKAVSHYDYCYYHKCQISTCNNPYFWTSNYCYSHYLLYDEDAKSAQVSASDLKITKNSVYNSSSYTRISGTIRNNSDTTVYFVKIKGSFKTSSGTVVDTDWTYAVGGEGLAPGESCKWELSVDKDYSITKCDVSVLDFDC